jgi:DNA-binding beta-propeller fold protein YncE
VIDAGAISIDKTVPVAVDPQAVCYNPQDDKAYVASYYAGVVTIINAGTGIQEAKSDKRVTMNVGPTIVRGILYLPAASGHKPQAASLLDATGRAVAELRAGANDVSRLGPGVYFVRSASRELSAGCQKVVLTR